MKIKILLLLSIFFLFFIFSTNASALSTGDLSPSTNSILKGTGWGSPTNAYARDTNYAVANGTNTNATNYSGFNPGIPSGANIDGIQIKLYSKCSATTGVNTIFVSVSNNSGATWSTTVFDTGDQGTSLTWDNSTSQLWGLTWNSTSANNIMINVTGNATSTRRMDLDWIAVNISYIPLVINNVSSTLGITVSQSTENRGIFQIGKSLGITWARTLENIFRGFIDKTQSFSFSSSSSAVNTSIPDVDPTVKLQYPENETLEDTYSYQGDTTQNGDLTYFYIGNAIANYNVKGWIKFNNTLNTSVVVDSAIFYMNLYQADSGCDYENAICQIYQVSNQTWSENTCIDPGVNCPSVGSRIENKSCPAYAGGSWWNWNVTDWVQNQITADARNISFMFNKTEVDTFCRIYFYSKEYTTNTTLRPYLNITYHLAGDTTKPTFNNVFSNVTNDTAVNTGTPISLGVQWNDNVGLSMYVNSTKINNSGSWTNGTWQSFASGNWSNFTVIFPSEIGSNISIQIYANDTSNNQNVTGTWFFYNTTPTPPINNVSSTLGITVSQSTSNKGIFIIDKSLGITFSQFVSNIYKGFIIKTLSMTLSSILQSIARRISSIFLSFSFASSSSAVNTTGGGDTIPPTYSLNSTNSTQAGSPISHNLYWQDTSLSGYIFQFCNGGFNTTTKGCDGTSATKSLIYGSGHEAGVLLDNNGVVHTVNGWYTIEHCNNAPGTHWHCESVESGSNYGHDIAMAVDSNNILHLSHTNYDTARTSRYCNNTGGSWSCEQIEAFGYSAGGVDGGIAIDTNNKPHVAYSDANSGTRYCNKTGSSWTCTVISSLYNNWVSLAIDSNNNLHLFTGNYPESATIKLRYCNRTATNVTWSCYSFNGTGGFPDEPGSNWVSVAVDMNNKLYVAHINDSTNPQKIRLCNNANGSWSCETVFEDSLYHRYTSLALDQYNSPHIAFNQESNPDRYSYCNKNSGSWSCIHANVTSTVSQWMWTNGRGIAIKKGRLADSTSFDTDVHYVFLDQDTPGYGGLNYVLFKDYTSRWVNDTWVAMSGSGSWSNVTKTISENIGSMVGWCIYANDSANLWNGTSCSDPFNYNITTIMSNSTGSSSFSITSSLVAFVIRVVSKLNSFSLTTSLQNIYKAFITRTQSISIGLLIQNIYKAIISKSQSFSISTLLQNIYKAVISKTQSITLSQSVSNIYKGFITKTLSVTVSLSKQAIGIFKISKSQSFSLTTSLQSIYRVIVSKTQSITLTTSLQNIYKAVISKTQSITFTFSTVTEHIGETLHNISKSLSLLFTISTTKATPGIENILINLPITLTSSVSNIFKGLISKTQTTTFNFGKEAFIKIEQVRNVAITYISSSITRAIYNIQKTLSIAFGSGLNQVPPGEEVPISPGGGLVYEPERIIQLIKGKNILSILWNGLFDQIFPIAVDLWIMNWIYFRWMPFIFITVILEIIMYYAELLKGRKYWLKILGYGILIPSLALFLSMLIPAEKMSATTILTPYMPEWTNILYSTGKALIEPIIPQAVDLGMFNFLYSRISIFLFFFSILTLTIHFSGKLKGKVPLWIKGLVFMIINPLLSLFLALLIS